MHEFHAPVLCNLNKVRSFFPYRAEYFLAYLQNVSIIYIERNDCINPFVKDKFRMG